jgi:hypothetical protein
MARKQIFGDKRGRDTFIGGRRPAPTFDEVERRRPRKAPLRNGEHPSQSRAHTGKRSGSGGFKPSGIHVAVGLVVVGVVAFLLYFLFAVMPSPIAGLSPAKGTFVKSPVVDVRATFSRDVKPSQVALKVDGKDATMNASVSKKTLSSKVALQDGTHRAVVELNGGGLMGKRTATWSFAVDTRPPDLSFTERTITDVKGTSEVKVIFKGKADKGAVVKVDKETLPLDSKGAFKGTFTTSRSQSLKVTATDSAGNQAVACVVTQKPTEAKGVHVSIPIASSDPDMERMIGLLDRTELNALQIDLKDEWGQIGFLLDNGLVKTVGSSSDSMKIDTLVDQMRFRNVYSIGRVVSFKDPKLAKARPDLAVQDKRGGVWGKGEWLDPYSREVWDYDIAVATAAAKAGFNEIQFDYMRFPSDGNTSFCQYPHQDSRQPDEVINDFLTYARDKLAPYNVFVSADLFGLTASDQGDMNIGQKVEDVAKQADYISPMVYPSHYNPGEYGIKSPENNPTEIVSKSLDDFKKKISGSSASLRPWLQDFTLRVTYTPDMVRAQINACEKAGVKQWLLWDPQCTYTEQALKKQSGK